MILESYKNDQPFLVDRYYLINKVNYSASSGRSCASMYCCLT